MGNRAWLAKVVDTSGRPCPLRDGIPCPGTRKECAFWLDEVIQHVGTDGTQHELQGGCVVLYQYMLSHEIVLESVRAQAAMNVAAGEVQKAGQVWAGLIAPMRAIARQAGG